MQQSDLRFINEDGSIDYQAAMVQGRKDRARIAYEGFELVRDIVGELIRGTIRWATDSFSRGPETSRLRNKAF